MATYQGIYSAKKSNERKTVLLLFLFPIFLYIMVYFFAVISTSGYHPQTFQHVNQFFFTYFVPFLTVCCLITFFWQKNIIFSFTGAKETSRKENPFIYNIVENLCISKGLPTPKIWIIDTPGLNAFATGRRKSDSRIVFTRGLLQKLNKSEIEAVASHELTHLINKDALLMTVIIIFVGCITTIGQTLRSIGKFGESQNNSYSFFHKSSSKNEGSILAIFSVIWGLFLFLGYFIYPLLKFAISKKREFLADLGAVELTRDSQALISALQKIGKNSRVPRAAPNVALIFIATPNPITKPVSKSTSKPSQVIREESWDQSYINPNNRKAVPPSIERREEELEISEETEASIRDSHPSIAERIKILKKY